MNEEWLARVRELVADPTKAPGLHELLHAEAARVVAGMSDESLDPGAAFSDEEFGRRLGAYEALTEDLARGAALASYWTSDERINSGLVARLANAPERTGGHEPYIGLQLYPAVLVLYAAGLAAVIGMREDQLSKFLSPASVRDRDEWKPIPLLLSGPAAIDQRTAQRLPGLERRFTPASDHLVEVSRPWLAEFEADDKAFERAFDRWEFLLGLVAFDQSRQGRTRGWAPVGRFSWRGKYGGGIDQTIGEEVGAAGASWPLFRAGLFGGDVTRLNESLEGWLAFVGSARQGQH
jgi:hypothetical protein